MVSLARVARRVRQVDAAIREKLVAEFQERAMGAGRPATNVVVHDGVVDLWGMGVDERQRNALKVAAGNIPGVTGVKDDLVWIEPTSAS